MGREENSTKYTFRGQTGYVVAPWISKSSNSHVAIRHSAKVEPWTDNDIHLHGNSDEFYFLLSGILWLWVGGKLITLEPNEFLQVRKATSHAVVKGKGSIEHFVIRVPASEDRKVSGILPKELPELVHKQDRELRADWGNRVSIENEENRDCWLFGIGQAKLHSPYMCLAYMRYSSQKAADQYKNAYHHSYHAHLDSWEYYTVLTGTKTLRVEDEYITVNAGEILEVPPGIKHVFHELKAPFEGFTFRTPILDDKIEY